MKFGRIDRGLLAMFTSLALIAFMLFTAASTKYATSYDFYANDDQQVIATLQDVKHWGMPFQVIQLWDANTLNRLGRFYRRGTESSIDLTSSELLITNEANDTTERFSLETLSKQNSSDLVSEEEDRFRPGHLYREFDGMKLAFGEEYFGIGVVDSRTGKVLYARDESLNYVPMLFSGGFSVWRSRSGKRRRLGMLLDVYEATEGKKIHTFELPSVTHRPIYFDQSQRVLFQDHKERSLWIMDKDGTQRLVGNTPGRFLLVWLGLSILASLVWSLVWVFRSKDVTPFVNAGVAIVALHLFASLLFFGQGSVQENHSAEVLKACVIGVTASGITLLVTLTLLSMAINRSVFSVSALIVFLLVIHPRFTIDQEKVMEIVQLLALLALTQFALVALARRVGIRLIHKKQSLVKGTPISFTKLTIRDLGLFTAATALAFAVWRFVSDQDSFTLFEETSGIILGVSSFVILFAVMLLPNVSSLRQAVKVLLPWVCFASLICWAAFITAMTQRGCGDLWMCHAGVLISAVLLRRFGYRFVWRGVLAGEETAGIQDKTAAV